MARRTPSTAWPPRVPAGQDLPSLLAQGSGVARSTLAVLLGLLVGGGLLRAGRWRSPRADSGEVLLGGVGIGAVVVGGVVGVGLLWAMWPNIPLTLQEAFSPPTRSAWSR